MKKIALSIVELLACMLFTVIFTMAIGHVSLSDLQNVLSGPKQDTTLAALGRATEDFNYDLEDCSYDVVCTLAIALEPSDSYVTPILMTIGYNRSQSEYLLQFVVDTFSLYQG